MSHSWAYGSVNITQFTNIFIKISYVTTSNNENYYKNLWQEPCMTKGRFFMTNVFVH